MAKHFPLRVIAHRGDSAHYPENTLLAFEKAIEAGADVLETDAHMTTDGHIVLAHDDNLAAPDATSDCAACKATNQCIPLAQATLSEVRAWDAGATLRKEDGSHPFCGQGLTVPTLHELLDLAGDRLLNIDIKQRTPPMVKPMLDLLRDRGVEEQVTLASFYKPVIRQVRELGFRGTTALSYLEVAQLWALPRWLASERLKQAHAAQVKPRSHLVVSMSSRRFINKCHELGLRVDFWTIDDPECAQKLLERGADGIITNEPKLMREVIDRHRTAAA